MDLEYNNNMCPHHKSFKIYNNGKKGFEYQGNLFYGLRMESFVKREKEYNFNVVFDFEDGYYMMYMFFEICKLNKVLFSKYTWKEFIGLNEENIQNVINVISCYETNLYLDEPSYLKAFHKTIKPFYHKKYRVVKMLKQYIIKNVGV